MFRHQSTGEFITGYKDHKPSWSSIALPSTPSPPSPPTPPADAIMFTFSPLNAPKPQPPPPETPVERIVLPPLNLPFRNPFDEVMSRLFRRKPTPLDMVMRTLFAKYGCNWVTLAHITMVIGEYGMSLESPLQLVACQTGPMGVPQSWGYYFPYFDAQEVEPNQWYFAISTVFHTVTQ